jgi:hypothetical protein
MPLVRMRAEIRQSGTDYTSQALDTIAASAWPHRHLDAD